MSNKRQQWPWYLVLFVIIAASVGGFYTISQRFDYAWSWHRMPTFFYHVERTPITSPFDGSVIVTQEGTMTIRSDSGETFAVNAPKHLRDVDEDDTVFEGDVVAFTEKPQAGVLILGLLMTLRLSLAASLIALFLGIVSGLSRVSKNPVPYWLSTLYIEAIRGTPLLVQLFIIYFMVGSVLGIDSRFWCGSLALGLFAGAYAGEIIRAGITSIHHGQSEAARSLGLSHTQTMSTVIMPQVFKRTLPALAGTFISLIKDSSLVSVMALTDLTKAGREVVSSSFMVFETWITVAAMYFLITISLSLFVKKIEGRLAKGERG